MGHPLPPSGANASPLPHDPQLDRLVGLFWRERWIILTCTILAVVMGCVYVARRGTVWQVSSRLYVERTGPSILSADNLLMAANSKNYANTQAALLRSTPILAKALDKRGLDDREVFKKVQNRIAWMKRNLQVKVGRNDDIISVSLKSTNVDDACVLVNAVVDQYIAFHASKKKSTRAAFLEHLTDTKDKHIDQLLATEKEMTRFKEANSVLGLGQEDAATFQVKRLHEVYAAFDRAKAAEAAAKEAWIRAKSLRKNPRMLRMLMPKSDDGFRSSDLSGQLRSRLWDLEAAHALMINKVAQSHPMVAELEVEIAEVKRQLAVYQSENQDETSEFITYLRETYTAAKESVTTRREQIDAQEALVRDVTRKNLAYSALDERITNSRERIDELTKLIEQLNLADINEEEKGSLNVMVLDPARAETASVTTTKFGVIAVCMFLGLLGGLGIAWLRGTADQRLRSIEDVTNSVNLPVLGSMPRTNLPSGDVDAIDVWDRHAYLSEAARSLRTALYFGLPEGEGRVVQITSADPAEGKSLTSSMLSIAMARAGQRTLIIDADLRRPTQVGLFGVRNDAGLSTALTSTKPIGDLIQSTDIENLDILTSGPIPENPAELLSGPAFDQLLETLGETYDRILVDSAPIMPVADSRIIAPKCDTTLLVMRADSTRRKRANAAREIITSVGGRILGGVLNGIGNGFGYGGYGGYSGYGGHGGYAARKGGDYIIDAKGSKQPGSSRKSKVKENI